jgi:hypothetical protein
MDTDKIQLEAFKTELSKVMPSDFKDWWQNNPSEWPIVARLVIENLKKDNDNLQNQIEKLTNKSQSTKKHTMPAYIHELESDLAKAREHIKQLESAGDSMCAIAERIFNQNGEDMYWIRKLEDEITEWIATKETEL